MVYSKPLPPVRELLNLARTTVFPATRSELVDTLHLKDGNANMESFLTLFPADEIFENPVDFMTRSEELEILINQERMTPAERLRSPQG